MTIKHLGGIFGRNPTFNDVTIDGPLSANDNIVMANGKGIDFSATSGTGTSELFDDYEEGTWTPTIEATTGSFTTLTYSNNTGYYTKVGRLVTVQFNIFTSNVNASGASGAIEIAGLPFTVGADNYAGSVSAMYRWAFGTDRVGPVMISAISGQTHCSLYQSNVNASSLSAVDVTDLQSGAGGFRNAIIGTITYAV